MNHSSKFSDMTRMLCVKDHGPMSSGLPHLFATGSFQPRLKPLFTVLLGSTVLLTVGCSSLKTPATADVAVSNAAVVNAVSAGGVEYAPVEMSQARENLAKANQAMANKDYKLATELANQAQADAKLAQGKAESAKAQAAAKALQDDINVLREELNRTNK